MNKDRLTPRQAWAYLEDLLEHRPGYLKIVVPTPHPERRLVYPATDPRHFEAYAVKKLERFAGGVTGAERGWVMAWAEEDAQKYGPPFPMLQQLTRFERAAAPLVLEPLAVVLGRRRPALPPGSVVVPGAVAQVRAHLVVTAS